MCLRGGVSRESVGQTSKVSLWFHLRDAGEVDLLETPPSWHTKILCKISVCMGLLLWVSQNFQRKKNQIFVHLCLFSNFDDYTSSITGHDGWMGIKFHPFIRIGMNNNLILSIHPHSSTFIHICMNSSKVSTKLKKNIKSVYM